MTAKSRGLGRNLSALLGTRTLLTEKLAAAETLLLPVDCLQPGKYQPRRGMEETALEELAESIKTQGLLQPLIVRKISEASYEIIAGERRWRASLLAGLKEIPVIVRQVNDETAMAIGLIENLQREDLNPIDQARAMHRLTQEFQMTHQQVAEVIAKSRAAVSNYLRLLNLNENVKQFLEQGLLEVGHARALLILTEEEQINIAQQIIDRGLSVRETEKIVSFLKDKTKKPKSSSVVWPTPPEQLQLLGRHLDTKVTLQPKKSGKGFLMIHYETSQRLQAVIERLLLSLEKS